MSTILNALRRLEEEQNARVAEGAPATSLEMLAAPTRSTHSTLSRIGLILASVSGAAIAGAIATWLFIGTMGERHEPASEANQIAASARAGEPDSIALADQVAALPAAANSRSAPEIPAPPEVNRISEARDGTGMDRRRAAADGKKMALAGFASEYPSARALQNAESTVTPGWGSEQSPPPVAAGRSAAHPGLIEDDPWAGGGAVTPLVDVAMVTREQGVGVSVTDSLPAAEVRPGPGPAARPEFAIAKPDPVEPPPVIVRSQVPSFAVKRTTWHPTSQRRRAEVEVVEGDQHRVVELREGQFLGPLEVEEIRPTGVTFLHNGIEIHRRVGSKY